MSSQASLDVDAVLRDRFGLSAFRAGQRQVIAALLERGAAMAVFPTGGGKSLCYQLPALLFDGVTLVVSPLIALMKDQIDFLTRRGIAAARLDSSLTLAETKDVNDRVRSGTLKLLYVSPERFANERFTEQLRRTRISLFAVDEAHCISEWGHNFRPDYLKLAQVAQDVGVERRLALTATATPEVVRDVCDRFSIPHECAVVTGFYRPNLQLNLVGVQARERDALLLSRLRSRPSGPTIVYVTLQKTAERVANLIVDAGLPARAYHAGMDADERAAVQDWWMASDGGIVVATIAFGMGIDKADVRYVYHYNLPKSLEGYSQEIGRAGRDGAPSVVGLLACADDVTALENFVYGDTPSERSLRGMLDDVLDDDSSPPGGNATFDVDLNELSSRHDARLLVVRTALTYLELFGVLRQGTPFYAAYRVRPLLPLDEIATLFQDERRRFLQDVFGRAKKGRTWYTINADEVAQQVEQDRSRIVRMLDYLAEQGHVELLPADVRYRYERLAPDVDREALLAQLLDRFQRHEERDLARIRQVLGLVAEDRCQANALASYFGERRTQPCGRCTRCRTSRRQAIPAREPLPPISSAVDARACQALRAAHPDALGESRQLARFLCGLTSPALTRAKLARHELFGSLVDYPFSGVEAWCATDVRSG